MPPSPTAPTPNVARTALQACLDLAVLLATSITFTCVLTAQLQTERLGWVWPSIPYDYTRGDVWIHALLASLIVIPVLMLCRRQGARRSPRWQDLAFALSTLLVLRLGPPDAQVFGTTWTTWEITAGLFLLQWPIVVPLTVAAVVLRRLVGWRRAGAEGF